MEPEERRQAYRQFTTTVGLITTHGSRGPNVMAAEWTFNISYDPFLISVHIDPTEATHGAIVETGEFGVNLLAEDQVVAMGFAGHFSKYDIDKLSSEVFETYPAKRIRAPMIRGAILNAECRLIQRLTLGDHTAFVGEVVEFSVDKSKGPVVLHRGPRRLGLRIRRSLALVVAVAPSEAKPGTALKVAGELTAPSRASKTLHISLLDAKGSPVAQVPAKTGQGGDVTLVIDIPSDAPPGDYVVEGRYRSATGRARLRIQ